LTESKNERHLARMQRKNSVIDVGINAAQDTRGVLLINTGNGKGKSTAAFGLLARALGHGMNAVLVQFIKGRSDTVRAGKADKSLILNEFCAVCGYHRKYALRLSPCVRLLVTKLYKLHCYFICTSVVVLICCIFSYQLSSDSHEH